MFWLESLNFISVFITTFTFGLIPFMGPSNLVLAAMFSAIFPSINPVAVGLLVALGASTAKTIHYYIIYFARKLLSKEKTASLEKFGSMLGKWGALALFVAAATPIPDEPFIVPLGLAKYNIFRFFLSYFAGKIIITVTGALFGKYLSVVFKPFLGQVGLIIISIVLTVVITIILLRVDINKLIAKYEWLLKRKAKNQQENSNSQ